MTEENRPLWAPWRIEFIRSKKDGSCFLCKREKARRDYADKLIVYRGKTCFVILNRYPYNSGHLMVAPYRHIGDISDLTADERRELFDLAVAAKNVLTKLLRPDGFNAGFNLGLAAGAGVADHIHFHIVPRWVGDTNFMPVMDGPRVVPEAIEKTAKLIRKSWSSKI